MSQSWKILRVSAANALSDLQALLKDPDAVGTELVQAYVTAKSTLANAFEAYASERYEQDTTLTAVCAAIEKEMAARFTGVNARYLKVRGFGRSHRVILGLLAERVGQPVSVGELRMLTGDAVHTERRARELRALGLDIEAKHTAGTDVYVLKSVVPDVSSASRELVVKNIREDGRLSDTARSALIAQLS